VAADLGLRAVDLHGADPAVASVIPQHIYQLYYTHGP
jgi:hypothetical protein